MDRSEKILQILSESQSWIKSSEIAIHLNISTRTVRNDIKAIKDKYGEDIINSSNTKGYRINEEYIRILKDEEKTNNINQNGRLLILSKILIINEDGADIFTLAEMLYVSEYTIESDITKLRKYINRLGNSIAKIVRNGNVIKLIGKNTARNSLLYDIFINVFEGIELNDFQKCFDDINLRELYTEVRKFFIEKKLEFKHLSFLKLTLEIAILIEREKNNSHTKIENVNIGKESREIADVINSGIKNIYNIELTKDNKVYLEFIFDRFYKLALIEKNYSGYLNQNEKLLTSIREILDEVLNYMGKTVYEQNIYVDGLIKYIIMSIERRKLGLNCFNPLMNNLKNEYQYFHSMAITITNKLNSIDENINLNGDDISYIASYLVAILENKKEEKDKPIKIAVVVPEGLANLYYIASYINKIVSGNNIFVDEFLSIDDIKNGHKYKIIISTNNASLIYENSLLVSKNFNNIDKIKVKNTIEKEIGLLRKDEFRKSAIKFFKKDLFYKNININSKREAIKYLCDRLYEDGAVDNDFYDCVISRENIFESSIDSSVALPNDFFYEGKKTGAAVLVINDGVSWGSNKVKLVVMIVINKKEKDKYVSFAKELNKILLTSSITEQAAKCENGIQFRYMLEYLYIKEV